MIKSALAEEEQVKAEYTARPPISAGKQPRTAGKQPRVAGKQPRGNLAHRESQGIWQALEIILCSQRCVYSQKVRTFSSAMSKIITKM